LRVKTACCESVVFEYLPPSASSINANIFNLANLRTLSASERRAPSPTLDLHALFLVFNEWDRDSNGCRDYKMTHFDPSAAYNNREAGRVEITALWTPFPKVTTFRFLGRISWATSEGWPDVVMK
jgi:hypothetical protein